MTVISVYQGVVDGIGPAIVLLRACAFLCQEFGSRERIEVEHLGPGELSFANLVEAKNRGVKLPTGTIASALVPPHHDLILARGDRTRVKPAAGLALEWIPRLGPAWPSLQRCRQAVAAPGIGQRPRPVELQVIAIDLDRELRVALLNGPEHLQDHIDGAHR